APLQPTHRIYFTFVLRYTRGTFSHRCAPHTALSCTHTHHVPHPAYPSIAHIMRSTRSLALTLHHPTTHPQISDRIPPSTNRRHH
ncbi:hypothetical protein BGY98DRAFT_1029871, partial [Russula aff. rugulosa BPL654]